MSDTADMISAGDATAEVSVASDARSPDRSISDAENVPQGLILDGDSGCSCRAVSPGSGATGSLWGLIVLLMVLGGARQRMRTR